MSNLGCADRPGEQFTHAMHDAGLAHRHTSSMSDERIELRLQGLDEAEPGAAWRALWDGTADAYRAWWRSDGDDARPPYAESRRALLAHMPELVPTWSRLVELAGGGDLAARLLALWSPPAFIRGCSQAARSGPQPLLVRNYDYDPRLFEGVVSRTSYTGRTLLGTNDCLWGLLDGVNEDGLAVSLAFGGVPDEQPGFAIPLVLRYVLDTCTTSEQAAAVLRRVPVNMAYNVTTVDRRGVALTTAVRPRRAARTHAARVATNHQDGRVEWEHLGRTSRTMEREQRLAHLVEDPHVDDETLIGAFMEPPLRARAYSRGFGTLYTAAMRPAAGTVEYRWPGSTWTVALDDELGHAHVVLEDDAGI